jgi:hypothetical protein
MKKVHSLVALFAAAPLAVGATSILVGPAQAAGSPTEHVSPGGSDSGNCINSPCATINYAIAQAPAGMKIKVAAGTYHQTVDISKPVNLVGSGASSTIIDGSGIDPSSNGYYGVVYVGTTGGVTTVNGFTITNPYPDSYTGGEPEAVALADSNAADAVNIINNIITEGTADSGANNDFPIGIDTFNNPATTDISGNQISGFFQGALLEDNGPANVSHNTFSGDIASGGYPAEGVFFLSDLAGALTGQNATSNTFSGYSGYGIAMSAGYSNGNCTDTPCNGSLSGAINSNSFALTGGTSTAAIALRSENPGNDLNVTLAHNHGYVTAPSVGISEHATGGGTLSVTDSGDNIAVHAAPGPVTLAPTSLRAPLHSA